MDLLSAMRAFVAIVDHGSLTAAAAALDRAPPTMVRTLAALETQLGVRLLVRTTRRMTLTEEGRVYLTRCRRILSEVEEAAQAVVASDPEPRGELRVTAPLLFGQRHVAPALVEFVRRYPKVRVDLLLVDRIVHLVEEGIDLGVRIGALADSSLIALPVGQVRRVVAASPALLTRTGRPQHPSELSDRPCVIHHGAGPTTRWRFGQAGSPIEVPVESVFASNQVTSVVDACRASLGIGRFLSYQVEPEVRAGQLEIVLEEFEPKAIPVQIVYPDPRLMSPRLRILIDWMRDHLRGRPEIARGRSGREQDPASKRPHE